MTEPGDLILVKSPGWVSAFGRRIGGNAYDHVAVVSSTGETINIDKPAARLLPVDRLLRASLRPLVLRPRFASDDERARFLADLERLVGAPYDVSRTLALIARILQRRLLRRATPLPDLGRDRPRWICTDAVLLALERHVSGFGDLRTLPLDWVSLGSATTNDLLFISRTRPELLAPITPAPSS